MRLSVSWPKRDQSAAEELTNSISHGIALIAAIASAPLLIVPAAKRGEAAFIVGVSLYSATLILLFLSSTLYHALPKGRAKNLFRVIEHSAIYLLIAGTYTPFTLGVLYGPWGWSLFGVIWSLALTGIALKVFVKTHHPILSTCLYLLMGWLVVIAIDPLIVRVPMEGLLWLVGGGLLYTAGVAFFATDSLIRYGHFVWHLFVMAGCFCHYVAVLFYGS